MKGINTSRRRVLAGLGAVGLTGTGIVLGTRESLFSGSEPDDGDGTIAGRDNLAFDWQERHFHQSTDQVDAAGDYKMVGGDPANVPAEYVGLPDPTAPVVAVPADNIDALQETMAVEAFPDFDNTGLRDADSVDPSYIPCRDGAYRSEDLDPGRGSLRSQNGDTFDSENGKPLPLVSLDGVEPGEFGELALSFYLCDAPARVWLQTGGVSVGSGGSDASGTPETDDDGGSADISDVELAQAMQTVWWHETDGDAVLDEGREPVDVMVLLDESFSLDERESNTLRSAADFVIDNLLEEGDVRVGGIRFGGNGVVVDSQLGGSFDFGGAGAGEGDTPLPPALDVADQHLDEAGRDDAEQVIVAMTDGGPNYENTLYSAPPIGEAPRSGSFSANDEDQTYDLGSNEEVTTGELNETELVASKIKGGSGDSSKSPTRIVTVGVGDSERVANTTFKDFLRDRIASSPFDHHTADFENLNDIVSEIVAGVIHSEHVFRRGNLADDLSVLSSGDGLPLEGDPLTESDEAAGGDTENTDGAEKRKCFQQSTNYSIGFAWWLPQDYTLDEGTDSIGFDLGFFTEEC